MKGRSERNVGIREVKGMHQQEDDGNMGLEKYGMHECKK